MQTFLDRLDSEARDLLMAVARPITHAQGERLIRYGDPSRGAYLLKDGSCEATVLLEIPGKDFEKIYFGSGPAATKLRRAIQGTLLVSLGQTNRHLIRLISLARLRSADEESAALERVLASQIVWTLDERAA